VRDAAAKMLARLLGRLIPSALWIYVGVILAMCMGACDIPIVAPRVRHYACVVPDPLPPTLATEESDMHRLTGGKPEHYPLRRWGAAPGPTDAVVHEAIETLARGQPAQAYLAVAGRLPTAGTEADRYGYMVCAYAAGRFAEAYPAAKSLAQVGAAGWPGYPPPNRAANAIETLGGMYPRAYTVRDTRGSVLYMFYMCDGNLLARRMAPSAAGSYEAACAVVLGGAQPPAGLLPIQVYLPATYGDWKWTCDLVGERNADDTHVWGMADQLSVVVRQLDKHGHEACPSNDDAAGMLAHETAHVLQAALGGVSRLSWMVEGEAEAAGAARLPYRGIAELRDAARHVLRSPKSLSKAMESATAVPDDYCLYYALACCARNAGGLPQYRALMGDADLSVPRKRDGAYRRHLGLDSRQLCARTAEWLKSDQWAMASQGPYLPNTGIAGR